MKRKQFINIWCDNKWKESNSWTFNAKINVEHIENNNARHWYVKQPHAIASIITDVKLKSIVYNT